MDYHYLFRVYWIRSKFKIFLFQLTYFKPWLFIYSLNFKYWATGYIDESVPIFYCHEDYDEWEEEHYNNYYCYDEYNDEYEGDPEDNINFLDSIFVSNMKISEIVRRKDGYTALASKHMLIVDIDCGDFIDYHLDLLKIHVDEKKDTFRIYKTLNGMRYIQTNLIYQGVNNSAINILKFLESDPKYIDFCEKDGRFMARLTPKLETRGMLDYYYAILDDKDSNVRICDYLGSYFSEKEGPNISPLLDNTIQQHDLACRIAYKSRPLA